MFSIKKLLGWELFESELDQFLKQFDREHPAKSANQIKEIEKYARVFTLRDKPQAENGQDEFWNNF